MLAAYAYSVVYPLYTLHSRIIDRDIDIAGVHVLVHKRMHPRARASLASPIDRDTQEVSF